jgi:Do/DeqQ family serine protease
VIINSDGYIVTNNHVIDNAEKISVTMNDNRSFTAKVIGTDPTTDLALIKVEGKNLPYLSLSNSEQVKVGEWVLAVGNPYNLNSTVTAGIVSAKGRSINILNTIQSGDSINNGIESFIQTDAAINPGNSGGALVNLNGDLIGVNTAIASPTGSYSGYGFAVPSNIVKRVIEDLMAYGTVQRGLMGVQITSVNAAVAENYSLDVLQGAYVSGVQPNTAASEAGLKEGDVIVEIDDREIASSSELIGYVAGKRPGDKIAVTVNRNGSEVDYDLILRNRKGTTEMLKKAEPEVLNSLGVELASVSSTKLDKLNLSNGVQVKELNSGKIQSETDIREGFIITRIDGKRVSTPKQVAEILKSKEGGVLIEGVYEGSSRVYYYGMGM